VLLLAVLIGRWVLREEDNELEEQQDMGKASGEMGRKSNTFI